MTNITIQNIPTGLKIMLRLVGPPFISAAETKLGSKFIESNVIKKMLSLIMKFMTPLFCNIKK